MDWGPRRLHPDDPDWDDVVRFLIELRDGGDVLEPVPEPAEQIGDDVFRWRVEDSVHHCIRCTEKSQVAFIGWTRHGPRWLDLCHGCAFVFSAANIDWSRLT